MTYEEAIQFLAQLVNYERQSSSRRDLSLEAIFALLNVLGNPHDRLVVIHVAGSKGKGSVAAMLELILRNAGYRTGLYTSPQLTSLEERIRVNGAAITPASLAGLLTKVQTAFFAVRASHGCIPEPTFFDVITTLAFLCFDSEQVDVAIVEVGMGGRTDSTNVCHPILSIITSISCDHTRQLGNTLDLIAMEKAGIIKHTRPTISGVTADSAKVVIETVCRRLESTLTQLHADFTYSYRPGEFAHATLTPSLVAIVTRARRWPLLQLNLLGEHQAANAAVAIAAIEQLQSLGFTVSDDAVVGALAQVQWPARIEIVRQSPLVVLDCAHNTASAQALVRTLETSFPEYIGPRKREGVRRLLLFAASRDKDLVGILSILAPHFDRVYLTQYGSSPRAAAAASLLDAIRIVKVDLPATFIAAPLQAWRLMETEARSEDLLCVTGSVFLAGELRPFILRNAGYTATI